MHAYIQTKQEKRGASNTHTSTPLHLLILKAQSPTTACLQRSKQVPFAFHALRPAANLPACLLASSAWDSNLHTSPSTTPHSCCCSTAATPASSGVTANLRITTAAQQPHRSSTGYEAHYGFHSALTATHHIRMHSVIMPPHLQRPSQTHSGYCSCCCWLQPLVGSLHSHHPPHPTAAAANTHTAAAAAAWHV